MNVVVVVVVCRYVGGFPSVFDQSYSKKSESTFRSLNPPCFNCAKSYETSLTHR